MNKVLAIVLAGGEGKRLAPLTADRAKPAVPFGGHYRLIDFALSNLVNANCRRIVVLTQYKSHSLDRHLSTTWRLSPLLGNYVTPVPAQMRRGPRWFVGSADAIHQNFNLINDERPEHIIVFGADHIYRMDPRQMVEQHCGERRGGHGGGDPRADRAGRPVRGDRDGAERAEISAFREKPSDAQACQTRPTRCTPRWAITSSRRRRWSHRRRGCRRRDLQARSPRQHHPHAGRAGRRRSTTSPPTRCRARPRATAATGTTSAPWTPTTTRTWTSQRSSRSSISITRSGPSTPGRTRPARQVRLQRRGRRGYAVDSLICAGAVISGGVARRSILSPVAHLHSYAEVEDSILMQGTDIGRRARVRRAILDKNVRVAPGAQIGVDPEADRERFTVSANGVVVIAKGVRVEA